MRPERRRESGECRQGGRGGPEAASQWPGPLFKMVVLFHTFLHGCTCHPVQRNTKDAHLHWEFGKARARMSVPAGSLTRPVGTSFHMFSLSLDLKGVGRAAFQLAVLKICMRGKRHVGMSEVI